MSCKPCGLSLAIALFCAASATHAAQNPVSATANTFQPRAERSLINERKQYPSYFQRAYTRYPDLPRGILEAIAYSETGWRHVRPDAVRNEHERHVPAAYGVMGLYRGGGFANQVGEGAKLIGSTEQLVVTDPETNIMAAAALLDRAVRQVGTAKGVTGAVDAKDDANLAPALARYAGYGLSDGRVSSYARQSFAYNILLNASRGVRRDGIDVPARNVNMKRAFSGEQLKLLSAPVLKIDTAKDSVDLVTPSTNPRTTQALAVDFGEAIWNPASPSNYSTASNSTSAVIIHSMEGTYSSAINWFKNPSAQVSAHYLLRKSDGQITQMVREYHQAWHAAYHNNYTIGLEHEGYASDAGNWSAAMVNASARLTRSICVRRGVDCASAWRGPGYDTWHVVPDSVRVKGHGMLTNNSNRYDPGKFFPWANYYTLINNGAPPPASNRYWVDTSATGGYGSPTSTAQTGTLNAGTNYVYCKTWGRNVGNGSQFNHWWLKTDLDVGPTNQWVSAYALTRWGNDEARDNDGFDIPRCEVLPYGDIGTKWYALGGVRGILGVPTLAEMDAKLGGRFQQFDKGIVLWSSKTGAYSIVGEILKQFWATGGETAWGFATMDELDSAKSPTTGQQGRYQYFQSALLLWTPATGAHVVHGAILGHFEANGREATFGYPRGEEAAYGTDGRMQAFEKGTFYFTPQRGVWVN